jgi:uroporphyrinogen-III decarboxylase
MVDKQDEYIRLVKPLLYEPHFSNPPYYNEKELHKFAKERKKGDVFLWLQIDGFFWFPRECMGVEKHLYSFYEQPEFLHQINSDLMEYNIKLLHKLFRICVPDIIIFAEDMSYKKGPMLSPELYNEFISPYYGKIVPLIKEHGCIPMVDSDGNLEDMISWLEKDGIEGASPMERQAGTDIEKIRKEHPDFKMMGGFDKRVIHQGEEAMRKEFERILPVMRSGGYIPSVDHQTPPDVSLEMYRLYASLLNEYCRKL